MKMYLVISRSLLNIVDTFLSRCQSQLRLRLHASFTALSVAVPATTTANQTFLAGSIRAVAIPCVYTYLLKN